MFKDVKIIIDGSYFCYFTIFSAFSTWSKRNKIKPTSDLDPTKFQDFINILEARLLDKFELISAMLQKKFDVNIHTANIPMLFALDCHRKDNWRKEKFSGYKIKREIAPKIFNIGACFEYIFSTMLNLPQVLEKYNLIKIKSESAEGDDIIGVIVRYIPSELNIIFASDHDFLQLKNDKTQIVNLFGDSVDFTNFIKSKDVMRDITTWQDFLLLKILYGDGADCIPHVFPGRGMKKCIALVNDKEQLKNLLRENQEALNQFKLNSELIDFAKIPPRIKDIILNNFKEQTDKWKTTTRSGRMLW